MDRERVSIARIEVVERGDGQYTKVVLSDGKELVGIKKLTATAGANDQPLVELTAIIKN